VASLVSRLPLEVWPTSNVSPGASFFVPVVNPANRIWPFGSAVFSTKPPVPKVLFTGPFAVKRASAKLVAPSTEAGAVPATGMSPLKCAMAVKVQVILPPDALGMPPIGLGYVEISPTHTEHIVIEAVRSICRPLFVVFKTPNIRLLLESPTLLLSVKVDPLRR
jgi:hypothetical protein